MTSNTYTPYNPYKQADSPDLSFSPHRNFRSIECSSVHSPQLVNDSAEFSWIENLVTGIDTTPKKPS